VAIEDDGAEAPEDGGDEGAKKKGFLVPVIIGGAVALFAVVGVVLDAPGRVETMMAARAEKAAEKEAAKKAMKTIVKMDPFVVSLPQNGQIRRKLPRLSIAIALEVSDKESAQALKTQLRNDFIDALRAIDSSVLRSPEGLDIVRESLSERSKVVLGDDFHQVLITEFMIL